MAATITRISDRQPPAALDSAMAFAANLVAADRNTATRIRAALSAILDAPPVTSAQAAHLTELAQPWLR